MENTFTETHIQDITLEIATKLEANKKLWLCILAGCRTESNYNAADGIIEYGLKYPVMIDTGGWGMIMITEKTPVADTIHTLQIAPNLLPIILKDFYT